MHLNVGATSHKIEEEEEEVPQICSDSCASLVSLLYSHSESRPDILMEIMQTLYRIQMMGITVFFYGCLHILVSKEMKLQIKKQKQQ